MLLHQLHHQKPAPHLSSGHAVSYGLPPPVMAHSQPHHSTPSSYAQQLQPLSSQSRKRAREDDLELDISSLQHQQNSGRVDMSPHLRQSPLQSRYESYIPPPVSQAPHQHHYQQQHQHHHSMPAQSPPLKMQRRETDTDISVRSSSSGVGYGSSPPQQLSSSSVVGQVGMPPPAQRPRGPKLKFTPEDDGLLIDLKENKALTWKQIADFFPGRSSGTLQVRYCTKLKAKTSVWTDEMLERLRNAISEYEQDRWRIIALKVGPGFTPAACKEKSKEI